MSTALVVRRLFEDVMQTKWGNHARKLDAWNCKLKVDCCNEDALQAALGQTPAAAAPAQSSQPGDADVGEAVEVQSLSDSGTLLPLHFCSS